MPVINQLLFPSIITIITFVSSFIQTSPTHTTQLVHNTSVVHKQKKVLASTVLPTKTEIKKYTSHIKYEKDTDYDNDIDVTATPTPTIVPTSTITETQTPTVTPTPTNTVVTAQSTITANGKAIHLSLKYAKNGGPMTGTISGDCKGSATGTFSAGAASFSGSAKAACNMGFISLPVSIDFAAHLTGSTQATIHYSASAAGQTESGDTTVSLQ